MNDNNLSDRSSGSVSTTVLERARNGDQEAFGRIFALFSGLVYSWCRASGLSESDAEDVCQQVFLTINRGIGSFQREHSHQSFRAWIRSITRSRIVDHRRSISQEAVAKGGSDAAQSFNEVPDATESENDLKFETQELFRKSVELIRQEFSE